MARPKKTKTEDLARIRNNQRKCRERRREYIATLEQKVKYYEKERDQMSTGLQSKAQELLHENVMLKRLLGSSSMSDNCRALSHTDGSTGPHTDCEDVWIRTENPWLINDESGNFQEEFLGSEAPPTFLSLTDHPLLGQSNGTELNQVIARGQALVGSAEPMIDAVVNVPTVDPTVSPLYAPLDTEGFETMMYPASEPASSLALWPVLKDERAREDRSMLCSVAYRLILQFNKRQYNALEIDTRLRCGFRLGRTQSEGCRVDLEVLFAVLAQISA